MAAIRDGQFAVRRGVAACHRSRGQGPCRTPRSAAARGKAEARSRALRRGGGTVALVGELVVMKGETSAVHRNTIQGNAYVARFQGAGHPNHAAPRELPAGSGQRLPVRPAMAK